MSFPHSILCLALIQLIALLLLIPKFLNNQDNKSSGNESMRLCLVYSIALASIWVLGIGLRSILLQYFFGLSIFGLINLLFVDLAIVLPIVGIFAIWQTRKMSFAKKKFLLLLLIMQTLLLLPGYYSYGIEPFLIQYPKQEIILSKDDALSPSQAIKIAVLADVQCSKLSDYEFSVAQVTTEGSPDLIVLPGDLFQASFKGNFSEQRPKLKSFLKTLQAPYGVYFVSGNVDDMSRLEPLLLECGVTLLDQKLHTLKIREKTIHLAGIGLAHYLTGRLRILHQLATFPKDEWKILLTHVPDVALQVHKEAPIDLVIGGHTHGGQIVLPFFGPPMTLSKLPRTVAAGGLWQLEGCELFISRGVGCERAQAPRIRFLCRPEAPMLLLR